MKLGNNVTCLNRSGHHVCANEFDSYNEYTGVIKKQVITIDKKGLAAVTSFFCFIESCIWKIRCCSYSCGRTGIFSFIPKIMNKRVVVTIHGIKDIIFAN